MVIRYLERRYVNAFFSEGELQLSCFSRFADHTDGERQDSDEGRAVALLRSGDDAMVTTGPSGRTCYVLSCSAVEDFNLARRLGYDAYFRIVNLDRFAEVVARAIPGCDWYRHGPCEYAEKRELVRDLPPGRLPPFPFPGTDEDIAQFFENLKMSQSRLDYEHNYEPSLFLKLKHHEEQHEYRLIWRVDEVVEAPKVFYVPDVRAFCEKCPDSE
jgi:hypothetical protein